MTIRVQQVSKRFDERVLWQDLSFDVPAATMTAIVGPSGVGKSTLLNCIGTLDRVDEGVIHLNNHDLTACGSRQVNRIRRGDLGYLFQDKGIIESESVAANLGVIYGPLRARRSTDAMHSALERVGVECNLERRAGSLSGGEQQRVALARLLLKRPPVVLCDEPTGSLDIENARVVMEILRELAAVHRSAVVIATHSPDVVEACDQTVDVAAFGSSATARSPSA